MADSHDCAKLKVIIASGNVSSAPGEHVAHAFFRKPYAPDDIVNCVERLLAIPSVNPARRGPWPRSVGEGQPTTAIGPL